MSEPSPEPTSPLQIADYRRFWLARFLSVFATLSIVVLIGYQTYDVARAQYGMGVKDAAFMLGLLGAAQFVPLFLLTPVAAREVGHGLVRPRIHHEAVRGDVANMHLEVAAGAVLADHREIDRVPGRATHIGHGKLSSACHLSRTPLLRNPRLAPSQEMLDKE